MNDPLKQQLEVIVRAITNAANAFTEQSAKATEKYVKMRDKAQDELKKAYKEVKKAFGDIKEAIGMVSGSLRKVAQTVLKEGGELSRSLKDIRAGLPADSDTSLPTDSKQPGESKAANADNSTRIDSRTDNDSRQSKAGPGRSKNKRDGKRKQTGSNPNSGRPNNSRKNSRRKQTSANKIVATPAGVSNTGAGGKASVGGGLGGAMGKLDAFSQMASSISSMQGNVSNILTGVEKAAKSGDFTPLMQELSKMPGAIGQGFEVALQGFQLGKQINKMIMDHGGQKLLDKASVEGSKDMNNSWSAGDKRSQQNIDNTFKMRLKELVKAGWLTNEEADQKKSDYRNEKKENSKKTYTEMYNLHRNMKAYSELGKKYGAEKVAEVKKKEEDYVSWYEGGKKEIDKRVDDGEIKRGGEEYWELMNKLLFDAMSKLKEMVEYFKKLEMKPQTEKYEEKAREAKSNFDATLKLTRSAADSNARDQRLSESGRTREDKVKALRKERDRTIREADAIDMNPAVENADKKKDELSWEAQKLKNEIDKLEKGGGGSFDGPGENSNGGNSCCEPVEGLLKSIAKNVGDIAGKVTAPGVRVDNHPGAETVGSTNASVENDAGLRFMGGDARVSRVKNALPDLPAVPAVSGLPSLPGPSSSPAVFASKARVPMSMQSTVNVTQESNKAIHQTLKQMKDLIERRLPGDAF